MIIGIDLGTTNSLVAYWQDDAPQIIPNAFGDKLTPSIISLCPEEGTFLVGRPALYRMVTHSAHTISNFKRLMGSDKVFELGNYKFRAEDLSALVLKQLKEDAENFLDTTIDEAVISVPAYFSDVQRKAVQNAGKLAGLKVERLINEPTAAGIAYGIHEKLEETNYLICDLGGGTFDVSILNMFSGIIEVRASAGDNTLGGLDFTHLLESAFIEKHLKNSNIKGNIPAGLRQKIYEQAEIAKHKFSLDSQIIMKVNWDSEILTFECTLAEFSKLAEPLLERLAAPIRKTLNDSNLSPSQIDQVVLVGGATRMPLVKNLVARMFRKLPLCHLEPDTVIAHGAAIQAGLKANNKALEEIVVTDVSPYSLGIAAFSQEKNGGTLYFDPIIERNTTIPTSRSRIYHPVNQNQECIDIKIYQGENFFVEKNIFLGKLEVSIPKGLKDRSVEIRFTYDINGLLEVDAIFLENNVKYNLIIQGNPGSLTEQQINVRLEELKKLKIHPREEVPNLLLLNRAERLFVDLQNEMRNLLANSMKEFISILNTQDPAKIFRARIEFEKLLNQVDEELVLL